MKVLASAAALLILCGPALANDCVVRVAYPDRDRQPYYIGNGAAIPSSPGAGAEVLRQAVRATGCTPELVRLPPARIKLALSNGSIDFALVDLRDNETPYSALPLTPAGLPDTRRGMRLTAVVYVRAVDGLPATTNPRDYFRNRILASNQASSLGDQLRSDGYKIDDGAADASSNMEKLMFRRVEASRLPSPAPTRPTRSWRHAMAPTWCGCRCHCARPPPGSRPATPITSSTASRWRRCGAGGARIRCGD